MEPTEETGLRLIKMHARSYVNWRLRNKMFPRNATPEMIDDEACEIKGLIDAIGYEDRRVPRIDHSLSRGVPSLKCLRLIPDHPENTMAYLEKIGTDILNFRDHYVILGEVATTDHYIVLNIRTGRIIPGMVHLYRFETVPEDDL